MYSTRNFKGVECLSLEQQIYTMPWASVIEAFAWSFIFIQSIYMQAKLYVTFRLSFYLSSTLFFIQVVTLLPVPSACNLNLTFFFSLSKMTFTLRSWPRWIFVFLCTSRSREYLLHYISLSLSAPPFFCPSLSLSRHLSSLSLILYIFVSQAAHLMCSAGSGGGSERKRKKERDQRWDDAHHIPFSL